MASIPLFSATGFSGAKIRFAAHPPAQATALSGLSKDTVRFGGKRDVSKPEGTFLQGGLTINSAHYHQLVTRWSPLIQTHVDAYARRSANQANPNVVKKLQAMDLDDVSGIPPSLFRSGRHAQKTTHGALAMVVMDILAELPPVASAEEAIAQLFITVIQVKRHAQERGAAFVREKPHAGYHATMGILPVGRPIIPLAETMYSALQNTHMVLIEKSGAIKIIKLPTPMELVAMIEADSVAQQQIDRLCPLSKIKQNIIDSPQVGTQETLAILKSKAEIPLQETSKGLSQSLRSVHSILEKIKFDYDAHIAAGRLKVLLDKPSAALTGRFYASA